MQETPDILSQSIKALVTPHELISQMPVAVWQKEFIKQKRHAISQIIQGKDDRLLVIVGPCSIHDERVAVEYAQRLKAAALEFADDLCIVMRVYFEKPRTSVGWKGLIRDPFLNNSFDINYGLQLARKILLKLVTLEVACATEFLDTIIPHYLSDLISWSAIGARTSASQTHRELASGLAMPVGFKNTTDGNVNIAIEAVNAAQYPQHFLSIAKNGMAAIIATQGNTNCHIILRGADCATNYAVHDIHDAVVALQQLRLKPFLMVDCSHGNSQKNYKNQSVVLDFLVQQIARGAREICGVMLESNLVAGKQVLAETKPLVYGQSITDACISWEETLPLLKKLVLARRLRRMKDLTSPLMGEVGTK